MREVWCRHTSTFVSKSRICFVKDFRSLLASSTFDWRRSNSSAIDREIFCSKRTPSRSSGHKRQYSKS